MKKLKKWIDEIRAESKEYAAGSWMCRYSGDTAEFIVHPHVVYHPDRFKHTVIRIGMILTRLSKQMEEAGYIFHVQTFPSLEDLKIVASIRLNVNLSQGNQTSIRNSNGTRNPDAAEAEKPRYSAGYLKKRAQHHRLKMVPVTNTDELPQFSNASDSGSKWYLIGSSHDNPFNWLHVGFFAEELLLALGLADPANTTQIISGPELSDVKGKLEASNEPAHIHACIAFNEELEELH